VEATNACRIRRTRGEILRRLFLAAVACALLDFADGDFAVDDLAAVDFVVLEAVVFFGVCVCAGAAAALWSACCPPPGEDAHKEPQAIPATMIRTEVRE
jgi:hypothetical protein